MTALNFFLVWIFKPTLIIYAVAAIYFHFWGHKKYTHKNSIKDQVILVTGGTSGIGEATVRELFLKGAKVIFTGRNDGAAAIFVLELLSALVKCAFQYFVGLMFLTVSR